MSWPWPDEQQHCRNASSSCITRTFFNLGGKSQEYLTLVPGSKTSSLEDRGMWDTLCGSKTWSLGDRGMYAHFGGVGHSGFPIPACGKCLFWGHLLELVHLIFSAH